MADTSPRNVTGRGLGLYAGKTPFGGAKYRNRMIPARPRGFGMAAIIAAFVTAITVTINHYAGQRYREG